VGRYAALVERYNATIQGQFYGHVHVDEFAITRSCSKADPNASYVETTGIKWCSGGGDYAPGNVFGAGVDGVCPVIPTAWSTDRGVTACEAVCNNESTCLGFTMYFNVSDAGGNTDCCFRTGRTSYKPPDPTSTARCYEKPANSTCAGNPTGVILPGPSLTQGYPATNPSVRLLEFDATTYALVDVQTFVADLHAGNQGGELEWRLEYSHRERFGMSDLSPAGFAAVVAAMAANDSAVWDP
jgi:hypothetical protein